MAAEFPIGAPKSRRPLLTLAQPQMHIISPGQSALVWQDKGGGKGGGELGGGWEGGEDGGASIVTRGDKCRSM